MPERTRRLRVAAPLIGVLVTWLGGFVGPASATAPPQTAAAPPQTANSRVTEIRRLARVVYAALREPSDEGASPFGWSADSFKGVDGNVYITFTLTVDRGQLQTPSAVVYVLAAARDAPPEFGGQLPARPSTSEPDDLQGPSPPSIAFEALYVIEVGDPTGDATPGIYRVSRAFSLRPGDYDLFVALSESTEEPGISPESGAPEEDRQPPGRPGPPADVMLLKERISVPNLWSEDLATSTIVLVDRVEELAVPVSPSLVTDPYALDRVRLVPAENADFQPTDQLTVTFFVYNTGLTEARFPDVTVDYVLYRQGPTGRVYYGRTNPQRFNAETLGGFEADAGHQIVAGQAIPLHSFSEGAYRLDIRVADNTRGSSLVRSVSFTVSGQ